MRRQHFIFSLILAVFCIGLLSANVYAGGNKSAETKAVTKQDNWEYDLALYVWMPKMQGTSAGGTDFEISFSDILDNLDMTLMTTIGARKNKWSFMTDVIYLSLDHSDNSNIGSLLTLTDVYI